MRCQVTIFNRVSFEITIDFSSNRSLNAVLQQRVFRLGDTEAEFATVSHTGPQRNKRISGNRRVNHGTNPRMATGDNLTSTNQCTVDRTFYVNRLNP